MSNPVLDDLFAGLIHEGEQAAARRKRERAEARKPKRTDAGWTTGKPGALPDKLSAVKQAQERRLADLRALSDGVLPGGWELEGITSQTVTYTCQCCGERTTALSPPAVFVCYRQTRHHSTKFLRPLKPEEYLYHLYINRTEVHIEHHETSVAFCQRCNGAPFLVAAVSTDPDAYCYTEPLGNYAEVAS